MLSVDKLVQKLELSYTVGVCVLWYSTENSLTGSTKAVHMHTSQSWNLPVVYVYQIGTHLSPKNIKKKVHSSTILNTPKLQTTHISIK